RRHDAVPRARARVRRLQHRRRLGLRRHHALPRALGLRARAAGGGSGRRAPAQARARARRDPYDAAVTPPRHESKRQFYNREREQDRERFDREPSKLHTAELLVPWVTSCLRAGDTLLDIAGGSGAYASAIARALPVKVVGVDISESMVRQRAEDPL